VLNYHNVRLNSIIVKERVREARLLIWNSMLPCRVFKKFSHIGRRKFDNRFQKGKHMNTGKGNLSPGYYVEGRYYGTRCFQARARAQFLTREYQRLVEVEVVGLSPAMAYTKPYTNLIGEVA